MMKTITAIFDSASDCRQKISGLWPKVLLISFLLVTFGSSAGWSKAQNH